MLTNRVTRRFARLLAELPSDRRVAAQAAMGELSARVEDSLVTLPAPGEVTTLTTLAGDRLELRADRRNDQVVVVWLDVKPL